MNAGANTAGNNPASCFSGRTALVVGGTTGIGRATVLALAARGARVCFAGLGKDEGREVVAQARTLGATDIEFMEIDVRREADARALVEAAAAQLGRIEIAVNNAGTETRLVPVQEPTEEEFYRVIDINLKGVWLGLKYQIPHMLAHGGGAIVNTS
ncbi:MAG TPA: SDR family NAD(P)-dependent oxidoreductase, partial [Steroidobacteraceae bacterium]|nr:SDR family NAD(P)-dependent oxidoreductase [Steroidobacteraceae bacterium]